MGFYINLVIGAISAPVYLFYLRLVAFSLAFVSAGRIWAWSEGRKTALIVVFAVLVAMYGLQQYCCVFTTARMRSFPGHLLRSRTQVLFYITTTCANTGMFFTTFYIPIYFQFTQNDSSLMATARLLPYLLITITFNLATGWALPKVKYYVVLCLVSGTLMTLAGALFFAYLTPSMPTSHVNGFSVLMAVGTGITMQLGYAVASQISSAPSISRM